LAAFAEIHPEVAAKLLGTPRFAPSEFGRRLLDELDELLLGPLQELRLGSLVARLADLMSGPLWPGFLRYLLRDARMATIQRERSGRLRSIGGTTPIITLNCWRAADRLLGVDAETLVFHTYYITGEFDIVLKDAERWFATKDPARYNAFRWVVFLWALVRYDSFYYFNDAGILPAGGYGKSSFGISAEEMRLIRETGKALYTLAYGADYRTRTRTMASGRWNFCMDCPEIGRFCLCDDEVAERIFSTIGNYATAVLGAGLSLNYLPNARDLDYLVLDMKAYQPAFTAVPDRRPLRIVHVPNHPHFKGTRFLEDAVARLQAEGHAIELNMLSGVSHEHVIELMKTADVVADQFIGGSFGQTAVEAMALGKPVLCYVREDRPVPEREQFPLLNANPDTLYPILQDLCRNPEKLPEIARRSRAYVANHYSLEALASRLDSLYREVSPFSLPSWPAWLRLRRSAGYQLHGAVAMSRWRARNLAGRAMHRVRQVTAGITSFVAGARRIAHRVRASMKKRVAIVRALQVRAASFTDRVAQQMRSMDRAGLVASVGQVKSTAAAASKHGLYASMAYAGTVARWGSSYVSRARSAMMHTARLIRRIAIQAARQVRAGLIATTKRASAAASPTLMRWLIWLARALTRWRMAIGRPRTLWGITPILTLPLLARADRALGLGSSSMVFVTYYISSSFDINLKRVSDWFLREHPVLYPAFTKAVLAWALLRYDAFHYFCDRGILLPDPGPIGINEHEMDLLTRSGKQLFTYTYGADVRTRQATLALGPLNFCMNCPTPGRLCICDDERGASNIRTIRRYATAMAAMGDMTAYVPQHVDVHFWPIDVSRLEPRVQPRRPGPLRIAHAPNHPHFKGTPYLEAAIARLQAEGCDIELVRVQGVPNSQVLELFRDADVVAEQFIGGFHGYTALEAMALAKPVLAYIRSPDLLIDADACPIVNTTPENLYEVLKAMTEGKFDLSALGRRGRAYVERHYSIEAVAVRLADMYARQGHFGRRAVARIEARARRLALALERPRPNAGGRDLPVTA